MTETPLQQRYSERDLDVFTPDERARFAPDGKITEHTAWQLLYRLEPELYERLIAGECIHPAVIAFLPDHIGRCVEVGAGTGRLTEFLCSRCDDLVVVEPAAALRDRLVRRFAGARILDGFFDALPLEDDSADVVISCSAFCADDRGLAEMTRVCVPGGLIVLVWPSDVDWLRAHGFAYERFDGEMSITFDSVEEATVVARIFYPDAADEIAARRSATVPYEVVGMNPPRDVAWMRVP